MEGSRQGLEGHLPALQRNQVSLCCESLLPSFQDSLGKAPEILDQAKLEHAGPCPELADRERCYGLECGDEPDQALRIQPSIAVLNQLLRQSVDSRPARQLARCQLREAAMIGGRQVVPHSLELGLRDVEVIEQPFRRRGDRLSAMNVIRQGPVRPSQDALVFLEPSQV